MRSQKARSPKRRTKFGPSRKDLQAKYHARGHMKHSLWLTFSARQMSEVVFAGTPEMLHHCSVEGDQSVASCVYQPDAQIAAILGDNHKTQFDALVRFKDRRCEFREIKSADDVTDNDDRTAEEREREQVQHDAQSHLADNAGVTYRRITLNDLRPQCQLIENWFDALPFIAACRDIPLQSRINEVLLRLQAKRPLTIGQLLSGLDVKFEMEYLAAIFLAAQRGHVLTDMDATPLTEKTLLTLPEVAP